MVRQLCLVIICCLLCPSVVYGDIDADYFYGPALRSEWLEYEKCENNIPQYICRLKCYESHICLQGKCWCINQNSVNVVENIPNFLRARKEDQDGSTDLTKMETKAENSEETKKISLRPALRHHIAHFCPNLDVARACIRTCMKQGKPAFCGKDHNCYCGHKYTDKSTNNKQDAKEMYAEFQDMYEKYFGPGVRP